MKKCCHCKINKPKENFSINKKRSDGISGECKSCHKLYRRSYYVNNTEKEKERVRNLKAKYDKWFQEIKSGLWCRDCNEKHPATLHFHHVDPNEKELGVGDAVHRKWSKSRVLEEIKKCIVLCANCHAKHHYNNKRV